MVCLTFLGHATFLIESDGQRLLIDPWFRTNPEIGYLPEDLDPTLILVTHNHEDHAGDAVELSRRFGVPIVATPSTARHYEGEGAATERVHVGGRVKFPWGSVKCVPAIHDSPLAIGQSWRMDLGAPCGFVVTIGGLSIYHAGDTALYSDMSLFAPVDVALLPIDGRMVMEPDDALRAAEFLNAGTVIPMHWRSEDPHRFVEKVRAQGRAAKVMEYQQTIDLVPPMT